MKLSAIHSPKGSAPQVVVSEAEKPEHGSIEQIKTLAQWIDHDNKNFKEKLESRNIQEIRMWAGELEKTMAQIKEQVELLSKEVGLP